MIIPRSLKLSRSFLGAAIAAALGFSVLPGHTQDEKPRPEPRPEERAPGDKPEGRAEGRPAPGREGDRHAKDAPKAVPAWTDLAKEALRATGPAASWPGIVKPVPLKAVGIRACPGKNTAVPRPFPISWPQPCTLSKPDCTTKPGVSAPVLKK